MPKKRDEDAPYWVQLRQAERSIIEFALEHGQSVRGTAAILGISANYLRERTRELNIVTPEIKPGPKPGPKPPAVRPPNLRVVAANGVPRPPTMPAGTPLQADTVDEDQDDAELEDGALDDEGDEDADEEDDVEDDAEDDTEDDAEDDADTEAQGGN
jgi:hypothetical protein